MRRNNNYDAIDAPRSPFAPYKSLLALICGVVTLLTAAVAVIIVVALTATPRVELVVINARVWTGDAQQPWAEAFAVADHRFVKVGSNAEILPLIVSNSTRVINGTTLLESAKQKNSNAKITVVPGFVDSHIHFTTGGFSLSAVQLRDAETREVFVQRIADFAAKVGKGRWILEGDWDHENWGGVLPEASWIDSVTPDNPVFVRRLDGHMSLANSLAMRLANVTADTEEVEGGTIVRYPDGTPTGIFKDNAMELIESKIPPPTAAEEEEAVRAAMNHVASKGVTSVHHMGSWEDLAAFERVHAAGNMRTRIYAAVPLSDWSKLAEYIKTNGTRGDRWLKIGNLKGFVDGSMGSHTALLFEPYSDTESDTGLVVTSEEDLYAWTKGADSAGLHVSVHAIGDRANNMILNVFARVAKENGPKDRRFRVEHAQQLRASDAVRFAEQGVIASMQPYHLADDGQWAEKIMGPERINEMYAFRTLLNTSASLIFGSDWFVAPPTPLEGIYYAVTRQTLDGTHPDGWIPQEKITVEEALTAYTATANYASYDEAEKGKIATGYLADFVVLDTDIVACEPESIKSTRVLTTFVDGNAVYTNTLA